MRFLHAECKFHTAKKVDFSKLSRCERMHQSIKMAVQSSRHVQFPQQQWLTSSLLVSLSTKCKQQLKCKQTNLKTTIIKTTCGNVRGLHLEDTWLNSGKGKINSGKGETDQTLLPEKDRHPSSGITSPLRGFKCGPHPFVLSFHLSHAVYTLKVKLLSSTL